MRARDSEVMLGDSEHGVPLTGGGTSDTVVVRVGQTVRRTVMPWSASMHALLRHLELLRRSHQPNINSGRGVVGRDRRRTGSIRKRTSGSIPSKASLCARRLRETDFLSEHRSDAHYPTSLASRTDTSAGSQLPACAQSKRTCPNGDPAPGMARGIARPLRAICPSGRIRAGLEPARRSMTRACRLVVDEPLVSDRARPERRARLTRTLLRVAGLDRLRSDSAPWSGVARRVELCE